MAKTGAQSFDPAAMAGPYAETMVSVGNTMVETMVQASQAYVDGILAAGQETVTFANRRLDADVKTCSRLASCDSYQDLAQLQQQWLSDALQDYSQEWARMASMFAERLNGHGAQRTVKTPTKAAQPAKTRSQAASGQKTAEAGE